MEKSNSEQEPLYDPMNELDLRFQIEKARADMITPSKIFSARRQIQQQWEQHCIDRGSSPSDFVGLLTDDDVRSIIEKTTLRNLGRYSHE